MHDRYLSVCLSINDALNRFPPPVQGLSALQGKHGIVKRAPETFIILPADTLMAIVMSGAKVTRRHVMYGSKFWQFQSPVGDLMLNRCLWNNVKNTAAEVYNVREMCKGKKTYSQ